MSKKLIGILLVFLLVTLTAVAVAFVCKEKQQFVSKENLTIDDLSEYELFQSYIDQGNCIGITEKLLNEEISSDLRSYLQQEDSELMDMLMLDAVLQYDKQGDIDQIAKLRQEGYLSDGLLESYWEVVGYDMPEDTAKTKGVDTYLLHGLVQAFEKNEYTIREIKELHTSGLIDDELHAALLDALGFDYMDEQYMEENDIAPIRVLSKEEKAMYETVLSCIDEGDCLSITERMLSGEVTQSVYQYLMKDDSEIIDFIVAQAMKEYMDAGNPEYLVRLRQDGFVSDECFKIYWEMMSNAVSQVEETTNDTFKVDIYLLSELEQLYYRTESGADYLCSIWEQGLLSDVMHQELIGRLGFDYTKNQ